MYVSQEIKIAYPRYMTENHRGRKFISVSPDLYVSIMNEMRATRKKQRRTAQRILPNPQKQIMVEVNFVGSKGTSAATRQQTRNERRKFRSAS